MALQKKALILYFIVGTMVMVGQWIYHRAYDDGYGIGHLNGFDEGFSRKKAPVIIIVPPKEDGTFVPKKRPYPQDSVLWRI